MKNLEIDKLKKYLKEHKISQASFAGILGVHKTTLNRHMTQKIKMSQPLKNLIFSVTHGSVKMK